MRILLTAAALLLLPACATMHRQLDREGAMIDSPARDWRAVATERDRTRLRGWRTSFVHGLAAARRSGAAARIAAEGPLLAPDAALPGPALPDGAYSCRRIQLGAQTPGMPDFVTAPASPCRVTAHGPLQALARLSGPQRPNGLLFAGDGLRLVFLGTLMLGDERRAMQYGGDPDRDMAGYVERIGAHRWRLILPQPRFESQIDIVELVPAS